MLKYADDTVIFFSSKNILDIEKVINQEAELIQMWIKENCLVLNKKKGRTEFILYQSKRNGNNCIIKVGNDEINQPQSYEYLGITLDSHLNLNEHYSKISKRISTRIKLLKKIRHKIPPTVAEQIYNSIIKPIFLYCSTINLGQSQTWENRFEKLQNQAKSVIGRNASNWPSIKVERMRKLSLEVFKSIHGLVPVGNKTFLKRYFYVSGNVWKTFFIGSLCTYELRFLETFEKRLGRTFEFYFVLITF